MSTPLSIGFIGVGKHARQILLPAIAQLPEEIRLVALATGHDETARQTADCYHLPCYTGHEGVLDHPGVEAVVIASFDLERQAIAALEAGKHVFSETPGVTSCEGAARIRELAREKGLVYQVGSCLRYAPIYQKMKCLLEQWREHASGPHTFGVHYYPYYGHLQNLLLFLNGDIAQVLTADGAESGISLYRFANGDIASLTWCGFHNVSVAYESVEIVHPTGRLLAEDGRLLRFDRTAEAAHPYHLDFGLAEAQVFQPTFSIPYGHNAQLYLRGYTPELADFARCVRESAAPLCGVDDAEKTLLVRQAAATSNGAWVSPGSPASH